MLKKLKYKKRKEVRKIKKIFLIVIGIMLSININSFSAVKKKVSERTQQTPQSVAVNFINGFFKAFLEVREEEWIYNNSSVTEKYKIEYQEKRRIGDILAESCPGEICSGYPIIGEGGDIYTGKFEVKNYNSSNGYVIVKPVGFDSEYDMYIIEVIKLNDKWMVDGVVSRHEEELFD